MTTGTGLSAWFGLAAESAYGTFVSPTRFLEMNSASVKESAKPSENFGLSGKLYLSDGRFRQMIDGAAGDIQFDATTVGMTLLLKAILGAVASGQPDSANQPLHYQHVFTPDAAAFRGQSYSVQLNVPSTDADNPFNFPGGKVTDWSFEAKLNAALALKTSWDFTPRDTATALATPTFPAGALSFIDLDMSVSVDGSSACLEGVTVEQKAAFATDRRCLGGVKKEPLANGEWQITGQLDAEFNSNTKALYEKFLSGARASLSLTASHGEIDAGKADPFSLKIEVPNLVFTGDTPQVGGPDIVKVSLPFKALDNGTDPIVRITYDTTDTGV